MKGKRNNASGPTSQHRDLNPNQLEFDLRRAPESLLKPNEAYRLDLQGDARQRASALGLGKLAERLHVRWHTRLRSTAGTANHRSSTISLNPRLVQFGHKEVTDTLLHELAHLVARERASLRRLQPHGLEWRQACADLGIPGEDRCHNLPLPRRVTVRRHHYACPHCGLHVDRVRPFRTSVACLKCCRVHNHGKYDPRFRLVRRIVVEPDI